MKNIYILIYPDVVLSSAAAPLDILTRTNEILMAAGSPPAFNVRLVSDQSGDIHLNNPVHFNCENSVAEITPSADGHHQQLILIPAFEKTWETVLPKNSSLVEWIREHYVAGTEVASLCKGAYFLAEAGILNGQPCTSHWGVIDDMKQRYPEVDFQPDSVITDQNGIYTGGGAFSSLNLVLYLVEKFCGHEVGIMVSKNFSIHRDHISQAHFSVFRGLNQHADQVILNAQTFIETHYSKDISVEQVACHVNMSKRNLIRRFKLATQNTPLEYIQRVKVEVAKKALENGSQSIQNLMYDVGYNDNKTFRTVFKRMTGVTPQEYRNKYGRQ
ncbi:AraC family transcriptional regulator [Hahella sp. CCB-MM4]|uniref:GlxA family transcriptional regulator n=1 Tax=Hahella sp. (strain CCB-MM4) TaxID=1926491 RepID=UPI000B9BCDB9|nr:helix-turn-helix domain-containing protein [Hahella sp. CCB-MM4]OZG72183.1 AraC family transcriptional regulator [Hahella sp. CCB-MM4]